MLTEEQINLTNLTSAGGCGCKLDPESLDALLCSYKKHSNKDLIIGFETADDCAVYEYSSEDYLLYTTDFFTPLVDDPYIYGALAAANAVSDIFAMGGKPLIANAILGFPPEKVPISSVRKILEGGQEVLKSVQCSIVGGHTIINPQPIYGFSIIGRVDKKNLKPNSSAKAGDTLLLTKPIGSGILSNALKLGLLDPEYYQNMITYLLEVNRCGASLGEEPLVHAMTDVTGFGLVGHAIEMAEGAKLCLTIEGDSVEFFSGSKELCGAVLSPSSGAVKNYKKYHNKTSFKGPWTLDEKYLFCDPQSNGGLLIAVANEAVNRIQDLLLKCNGRKAQVIGSFREKNNNEPSLILNR